MQAKTGSFQTDTDEGCCLEYEGSLKPGVVSRRSLSLYDDPQRTVAAVFGTKASPIASNRFESMADSVSAWHARSA